jgi:hypothetical protein
VHGDTVFVAVDETAVVLMPLLRCNCCNVQQQPGPSQGNAPFLGQGSISPSGACWNLNYCNKKQ